MGGRFERLSGRDGHQKVVEGVRSVVSFFFVLLVNISIAQHTYDHMDDVCMWAYFAPRLLAEYTS